MAHHLFKGGDYENLCQIYYSAPQVRKFCLNRKRAQDYLDLHVLLVAFLEESLDLVIKFNSSYESLNGIVSIQGG